VLLKPTAVLFDFDGVIVNSKETHRQAWRSAALEFWGTDPGSYPTELSGQSPRLIAAYFAKLNNDLPNTEAYMDLKTKHVLNQTSPAPLLPGAREMFDFLHKENIPFGIASNAPQSFVASTIERHELKVPIMLGMENYQNPKPNAEPYFLLADMLDISTANYRSTYIFEDSKTGLQAASSTGMYVVGITTAYDENILRESGAASTLKNVGEALKSWR
jgi:beta-phosphoglucomutase